MLTPLELKYLWRLLLKYSKKAENEDKELFQIFDVMAMVEAELTDAGFTLE